ncbi:C40 family peptidase [Aquisediminimonas sediminicola]|uniref:C40 family peptidase n=1 Tax=Alteraquisediminimonas sediminicola TaxID=2676787 RepID=UPI001FEC7D2D|nr:C40 family peptidase [Aquisediminimonas sediminicola]
MQDMGEDVPLVQAARAYVGVPFRPQGRDPALGLDCIGLVLVALRGVGVSGVVPADYRLRGDQEARLLREMAAFGLRRIEAVTPGAVLVIATGVMQSHLAIWTGEGLIHADAHARRVVERPGPSPWPIRSIWAAHYQGN